VESSSSETSSFEKTKDEEAEEKEEDIILAPDYVSNTSIYAPLKNNVLLLSASRTLK